MTSRPTHLFLLSNCIHLLSNASYESAISDFASVSLFSIVNLEDKPRRIRLLNLILEIVKYRLSASLAQYFPSGSSGRSA